MKKRLFGFLAFICIVTCLAPLSARADHGPKPSVTVTVENPNHEKAYATLLGPAKNYWNKEAVVVDGDKIIEGGKKSDCPDDVFLKLAQFKDEKGFSFYGEVVEVTNGGNVSWTYGTQEKFELLVYYPETQLYAKSDVCLRYTFDSFYKATINGVQDNGHIEVKQNVAGNLNQNIGPRLLGVLGRFVSTLIVEILLALAFGIRHKAGLKVVLIANIITQLALNLVILLMSINRSLYLVTIIIYILMEIIICFVEALIYIWKLRKPDNSKYSKVKLILYSLIANVCSAMLGFITLYFNMIV